MCDYTGHEFGGGYPDSVCIDGYLWDADSYEDGTLNTGGEWACPRCNTKKMLEVALVSARDEPTSGVYQGVPYVEAVMWEQTIAKAMEENPEAATAFLATVKPFSTIDWPDRQAVYDGRARWDRTIDRTWPWNDPTNG